MDTIWPQEQLPNSREYVLVSQGVDWNHVLKVMHAGAAFSLIEAMLPLDCVLHTICAPFPN